MTDKQDKRAKTNKNPENQTACCACTCGAGVRGVLALRQEETIQYPVINHNGKEYEKEYISITESLCCTAKLIQHYKSTIVQ